MNAPETSAHDSRRIESGAWMDGLWPVRERLFERYTHLSTEDVLAEFRERMKFFREMHSYEEAYLLEEWLRIWLELRSSIPEERFRNELILTLWLAFHFQVTKQLSTEAGMLELLNSTHVRASDLLNP